MEVFKWVNKRLQHIFRKMVNYIVAMDHGSDSAIAGLENPAKTIEAVVKAEQIYLTTLGIAQGTGLLLVQPVLLADSISLAQF